MKNNDDGGAQHASARQASVEEAATFFAGLPLIQKATALLEWMGDGKPVTRTGALRVRDLDAAAACVGVSVRGGQRTAPSGSVPVVRSMYEVPLLAQMWAALEEAELIAITPTRSAPSGGIDAFLAGDAQARAGEFHMFTRAFLEQAVLAFDLEDRWEWLIARFQASVLMAAITADPPSLERFLATPDRAPTEGAVLAALLTRMSLGRLETLADLGLLMIDTHFRVPPALADCVIETFGTAAVREHLRLVGEPGAD